MMKKKEKLRTTCMFPKCEKEVHEVGKKLCGEHQRHMENFKDKTLKAAGTAVAASALFIVKTVTRKK